MSFDFDVVVVGGGPGGYVAAIRAAQLGLKTACVESRGTLGGTCLNVGCIPSKALLQSSEHVSFVQHHAKEHGINIDGVHVDLKKLLKRKDDVVSSLTKGIEGLFKKNKITWLKGLGSFASANELQVKNVNGELSKVTSKNFIIATGSIPIDLKSIAPWDGKYIVNSTEALCFDPVPKHLIVIGGGYIGLEMGSVWLRLGSKVTVIEAQDEILSTMDSDIAKAMSKILTKQGMELKTATKLISAKVVQDKVVVDCQNKDGSLTLEADRVLVCVGRKAFTDGLGLEKVGLKINDRGKVDVNPHYQTAVSNIYAIGDVIAGPMLAHKAEDEGVACAELIAGKAGHVNYNVIPGVVYTWPEAACVGRTEKECRDLGLNIKVGQFPFIANGRAKALGMTDGFVKIIANAQTDEVLGVHMMGPNVSEMIAECAIAMEYRASSEDIARTCHSHPTLSEVVKEAALAVDKRQIHM